MIQEDEIIEIRNSRFFNALLFLGSMAFVAASLWILKIDFSDLWSSLVRGVKTQKKGWIVLFAFLFFGCCGLYYLKAIFDRNVQVRISKDGFYWRRWSEKAIPWNDIENISVMSGFFPLYSRWFSMVRFINFKLRTPEKQKGRGFLKFLARPNKILSGGDISLVSINLEISHKDLFSTLRDAHTKFTR